MEAIIPVLMDFGLNYIGWPYLSRRYNFSFFSYEIKQDNESSSDSLILPVQTSESVRIEISPIRYHITFYLWTCQIVASNRIEKL